MTTKSLPHFAARWRSAALGAVICAAAGVLVNYYTPLAEFLTLTSYDLAFAFRQVDPPQEVVIVYIDEKTYGQLEKQPRDFDRRYYAQLLEYLTKDRAKLVVFDIWFDQADAGRVRSDEALARAIRLHGKVVLKGEFEKEDGLHRMLPWEGFRTNAAGWGIVPVERDLELVVRQFNWRAASSFALPWVAASQIQAGLTNADEYARIERWLNYYGRPDTLGRVSFIDVTNQPPGFFRDRTVFIGSRTVSQYIRQHEDQFRTPYTDWDSKYSTGVEIVATAFLNLLRNEALRRLPAWQEIALIVLLGGLAGFGLGLCRPLLGVVFAVLGAGLVAGLAIALVQPTHVWFPWLIPVLIQIPCGWAWARWVDFKRSQPRTATSEVEPTVRASTTHAKTEPATVQMPRVSDHELLRRIGQGAYGEVWLARNAVGMLQAVKIVYRREFDRPEPYERELRGIEKFMPISRSHPGYVHILHIGRDDPGGLFYYMMELADDIATGRIIHPDTYVPKTLASALRQQGPWPIPACVGLGLALSAALCHLHRSNLIHRDLKPANILFVNGAAKLGDIGLVTDVQDDERRVSYVGTPGFIPPEGPGTPAADVYGLGKLLYETAFGWPAERFPETPSNLEGRTDQEQVVQFQEMLWRACEPNVVRRYASAEILHADLLQFQARFGAAPAPPPAPGSSPT